MAYGPIRLAYNTGQLQSQDRYPESATQTFKQGVPTKLSSGYLVEVDSTWAGADVIFGVNSEPAHNLTASGTSQGGVSEATPPNQSSASIVPVGAWVRDGLIGTYQANGTNVFQISLKTGTTFSQGLVLSGTYYNLAKDATTGYWYCDSANHAGNSAVLEILGSPSDDNTMVFVRFKSGQRYFD